MKTLPVPPLHQTLERYVETVAPLLDDDELAATRQAVESFEQGDGPACQQALEEFAAAEDAAGRSWLWDAWLEGYYVTRTPLPLTSNVGFEIVMPTTGTGLDRAAEMIHRTATVYLAHLLGEGGEDLSARGEPLCLQQWRHIAGGIRDPRPGLDVFQPGRDDGARREVVVLWQGRAFGIRVSDGEGRALSVAAIRQALETVMTAEAAEGAGFTGIGHLAAEDAAPLLAELQQDEHNATTYTRLREALFLLALSEDGGDLETQMWRSAFDTRLSWPYKPVAFRLDLADDFTGLHLEHSTLDGSSLVAVLGRAQDIEPTPGSDADEPAGCSELTWELTDDQRRRIEEGVEDYRRQASHLHHRILRIPMPELPPLPFKFSLDACLQTVMLYAQLRTYGRVRSTYESVDMREYQAGRTECLRPNTAANVALAHALLDGTATPDDLAAHLESHRQQVKRAKSGQAIDRHLFGLRLMAERDGYAAPMFDDPGYARLTTDFLSTTSLGDPGRIVRAAFAPTSKGGIGIYYVADGDVAELSLNYDDTTAERVDEFAEALHEGVDKVWGLLATAATSA